MNIPSPSLIRASSLSLGLALFALLAATPALSAGALHGRHVERDATGGGQASRVAAVRGPNGGGHARGRALSGDGAGNASLKSGGVYRGPQGATAARAGQTQVAADGSASHASGFQGSGARGQLASEGSATRSADGTIEQSRVSTATSASTGNTLTHTQAYSSETGLSRSTSCADSAGNAIACPSR